MRSISSSTQTQHVAPEGPVCRDAIPYTIQKNDTLWDLTTRLMEGGMKGRRDDIFKEILAMNPQVQNPDLIIAGEQLLLPGKPSNRKPKLPPKGTKPYSAGRPKVETPKPQAHKPTQTGGSCQPAPVNDTVKDYGPSTETERALAKKGDGLLDSVLESAVRRGLTHMEPGTRASLEGVLPGVIPSSELTGMISVEKGKDGTFDLHLKGGTNSAMKLLGLGGSATLHFRTAEGAADALVKLAGAALHTGPLFDPLSVGATLRDLTPFATKVGGEVSKGIEVEVNARLAKLGLSASKTRSLEVDVRSSMATLDVQLKANADGTLTIPLAAQLGADFAGSISATATLKQSTQVDLEKIKQFMAGKCTAEELRKSGAITGEPEVEFSALVGLGAGYSTESFQATRDVAVSVTGKVPLAKLLEDGLEKCLANAKFTATLSSGRALEVGGDAAGLGKASIRGQLQRSRELPEMALRQIPGYLKTMLLAEQKLAAARQPNVCRP